MKTRDSQGFTSKVFNATDLYFEIQNASATFQVLELLLKFYLSLAYKIVRKKLDRKIPFKFSRNDVKKDSLRKVLAKFEKFNSNKPLIGKMESLIKDRNYLAHMAYVAATWKTIKGKDLSKEEERIKLISSKAEQCLGELEQELERLKEIQDNLD